MCTAHHMITLLETFRETEKVNNKRKKQTT